MLAAFNSDSRTSSAESSSGRSSTSKPSRWVNWASAIAFVALLTLNTSSPLAPWPLGVAIAQETTKPFGAELIEKESSRWIRFRYQSNRSGLKIAVAAQHWGWDHERFFLKELSPGLYQLDLPEPWTPSLEYKLVINDQWTHDPFNPKKAPDGYGGFNSVVEPLSFQEDPGLEPLQPGEPRWRKSRLSLTDPDGFSRQVTLLHPPLSLIQKRMKRERAGASPTVTVYFQDGNDYLDLTGVSALFSRLATQHPELPLLTGVFIPPRDRIREYGLSAASAAYATFVARTVVPAVESVLNTGGTPERRLIIGPSLGGLISVETGFRYPDVFGKVASQSGSFWFEDGKILDFFKKEPAFPQQFFMEVGLFEPETMTTLNRKARDRARSLGLSVTYREYPSAHNWSAWRNRLREIFVTLLAPESSATTVAPPRPSSTQLISVRP
jgi:hypothetical protein